MPSIGNFRERTPREVVFLPFAVLAGIVLLTVFGLGQSGLFSWRWLLAGGVAVCLVALGVGLGRCTALRLDRGAMIDALTGLPNRRALHRDIASRRGGEGEVALAIVDLDGFKQVNDHFGHATGDELIRAVAILITETCGDEAQCYRLSGDEFVLLADGPIAGNLIEGISRMIVDRLRKPVQLERRAIAVGASVGLSRSGGEEAPASSELLRRADVAMFASKRGGKMRCTWYAQALDRNREARLDLDNELRAALAKGEFRVNYQPLVDARTGAIVAVESLLRWEREDGSQIGPNIFIPVAEESGLINAIGLWVLRTACRDARDWGDLNLSVNISAAQLRNPEFPILVGQVLEETGFPPERLELEVTETCLVLDPVVVGRSLDVIRQFGVSISLDDFGTGYASIGFLRQFRFEKAQTGPLARRRRAGGRWQQSHDDFQHLARPSNEDGRDCRRGRDPVPGRYGARRGCGPDSGLALLPGDAARTDRCIEG